MSKRLILSCLILNQYNTSGPTNGIWNKKAKELWCFNSGEKHSCSLLHVAVLLRSSRCAHRYFAWRLNSCFQVEQQCYQPWDINIHDLHSVHQLLNQNNLRAVPFRVVWKQKQLSVRQKVLRADPSERTVLRRGSAADRSLRLKVWIPRGAWRSVSCEFCVFWLVQRSLNVLGKPQREEHTRAVELYEQNVLYVCTGKNIFKKWD